MEHVHFCPSRHVKTLNLRGYLVRLLWTRQCIVLRSSYPCLAPDWAEESIEGRLWPALPSWAHRGKRIGPPTAVDIQNISSMWHHDKTAYKLDHLIFVSGIVTCNHEHRSVVYAINDPRTYRVPAYRRQPHELQWHSSKLPSGSSHVCAALEMPILLLQYNASCPLLHQERQSTAVDRIGVELPYTLETYKESSSDEELANCPLTHPLSLNRQTQMRLTCRRHRHRNHWWLIWGTQRLELLVAYSSCGVLRRRYKRHHLLRHRQATYLGSELVWY